MLKSDLWKEIKSKNSIAQETSTKISKEKVRNNMLLQMDEIVGKFTKNNYTDFNTKSERDWFLENKELSY
ncbi:hypothetical protein [Arcobacter peruensis]|uniref:hypothetical protein n=1 Tax=Arcobacter peruensis TaxID=2320140 RepID=UPI000F09577F|nr:hypothetical protein [Arcobacter peruensis]